MNFPLTKRNSKALPWLFAMASVLSLQIPAYPRDFKSGEDSPVHDSDRIVPVSGKLATLENDEVRISFDAESGAITAFVYKKTGWQIQHSPQLGESFRVFAPAPDRSYNPAIGARNKVASIKRSDDGHSITIEWKGLESEYSGKLDITLKGIVRLDGAKVSFEMTVVNHSPNQISTISWPIIGAFAPPDNCKTVTRYNTIYSTLGRSSIFPKFENDHGYYGTNYPMQMGEAGEGRYNILVADKSQGLYLGAHDTSQRELVRYLFELRPGFGNSYNGLNPASGSIDDHPVRIASEVVHYAFLQPGDEAPLSRIVLSPFEGDWHQGVDVYKEWRATWFHRMPLPAWAADVHSWQQIQINSAEDDLRTQYKDLPRRAEEAAKNGVAAIQLVGWNNGGQDRGNPSHNTDPRLGTYDDLKQAIAKIEGMGVHVILFNKYTWADVTTQDYKQELYKHIATDPNGWPYVYHGYTYQTPEQLEDINTRRLAVACLNDPYWLDLSAREFRKSIDLGASGILYDEVFHHGGASFCFSPNHGHHVPTTLFSGDLRIADLFRKIIRESVGEDRFLMGGEYPYDLETMDYSISYIRIEPGFIPGDRYADPFQQIMIAVTGFDDREMINRALMYRYIISYEPFNFKGNLSDFPLTMDYGKKVDALRKRYKSYLWNAEFRDNQGASVTVDGGPYEDFTVFRQADGKRAVVIANVNERAIDATIDLGKAPTAPLAWTSPEAPVLHPCETTVRIPYRSVVVVVER